MPAIQFMQTETRKRTVILMIPSSVKEEVYFPRRRLIFRFLCIIQKGLLEYIPKSISSVCWSVCLSVPRPYEQIACLCFHLKSSMLYIMNLPRRVLQSNFEHNPTINLKKKK